MPVTRIHAATLALAWLLASGGCHLTRGPVPESVAKCRQLSHQSIEAMESGDWASAERMLAQAIKASPTSAEARSKYAETLAHRGAFREAATQLEEALQYEHESEQGSLNVRTGEIYLAIGDLAKAREKAEAALDAQVDLGEAWALRGRLMSRLGDTQQALADMHRALGYSPDDPALLIEVAELYRVLNQPQRALVTLQRLADTYPPGEEPRHVLYLEGLAYLALERNHDASKSFYAASVRGQPSAEILYYLAEAERRAGRAAAAEANVRQALALDPRHGPSRALLGHFETAHRTSTAAPMRR